MDVDALLDDLLSSDEDAETPLTTNAPAAPTAPLVDQVDQPTTGAKGAHADSEPASTAASALPQETVSKPAAEDRTHSLAAQAEARQPAAAPDRECQTAPVQHAAEADAPRSLAQQAEARQPAAAAHREGQTVSVQQASQSRPPPLQPGSQASATAVTAAAAVAVVQHAQAMPSHRAEGLAAVQSLVSAAPQQDSHQQQAPLQPAVEPVAGAGELHSQAGRQPQATLGAQPTGSRSSSSLAGVSCHIVPVRVS